MDFRERLTSHQAQTNVQQQAREAKLEAARAKFAEAIAAFRNDLSQAADVLTEAGVPQTPIIGSSSTYSGRDSVTHYEWSGHSGWLFGKYFLHDGQLTAVASIVLPGVATMPHFTDDPLQARIALLPSKHVVQLGVTRGSFGRRPAGAFLWAPGEDYIHIDRGNVLWTHVKEVDSGIKSVAMSGADGFAPLKLEGTENRLQIRQFYTYYTEYLSTESWLLQSVSKLLAAGQ